MTINRAIKRVVDVVLSAVVLLVFAPVLVLTAGVICLLEGRPVFYKSRRFVSTTRAINIYKFRTMVRDATSDKYRLYERFMREGYLDIPLSCEVYTPIGRWVERTQIVEVPQLLNVLVGKMSLIGNRPLPLANVELLKRQDGWAKRFDSPAGISGIAQIVGKLNLAPRQRLDLESAYSRIYQTGNVVKCDLMILLYTLRVIALGKDIPLAKAHQMLSLEGPVTTLATTDLMCTINPSRDSRP